MEVLYFIKPQSLFDKFFKHKFQVSNSELLSLEKLLLRVDFIIVGVIIIVFRPRDFTNVGAVLNVKSTLMHIVPRYSPY